MIKNMTKFMGCLKQTYTGFNVEVTVTGVSRGTVRGHFLKHRLEYGRLQTVHQSITRQI